MRLNPVIAADRGHVLEHTQGLWEPLRDAAIFITGGTGFVGAWLLEALSGADDAFNLNVRITLLTRSRERFAMRFPHLDTKNVTYLEGDAATVDLSKQRADYVIAAATQRSFVPDAARPLGIIDADAAATRRVLDFAVRTQAVRMLFTSSGAVYGRQPPLHERIAETFAGAPDPLDAGSLYGESKRLSELACAAYARVHGLHVSIARLFAFAGPYLPLDEGYAVGNFIADALAARSIAIGGDGTPQRSYLYAADLAIWLWTILLRGESATAYNVGSGQSVSVYELARAIAALPEQRLDVTVAKAALTGAAPSRYVPDVTKAEQELGLRAWVGLEDALERTYRYHALQRTVA